LCCEQVLARSYPVILLLVKTAISVPNDIFENATRAAAALGMSRSEFFARAAERYLRQIEAESLTCHIDAALAWAGEDDSASAVVVAGRRRLARGTQGW
jgi:antitoxin MazE6